MDNLLEGVTVGGVNLNNLRNADDTVLIGNPEEKFQLVMATVQEACDTLGMEIYTKKNKLSIQLNDNY